MAESEKKPFTINGLAWSLVLKYPCLKKNLSWFLIVLGNLKYNNKSTFKTDVFNLKK